MFKNIIKFIYVDNDGFSLQSRYVVVREINICPYVKRDLHAIVASDLINHRILFSASNR
uniref:Uncharacterized protein n=1 Tax=Octopus bimaculoides TaxID=37653 RepID=A0A0L8FXY2_OCTBM